MWEVACSTLDSTACSLEVDPEEVAQKRFLEVTVDVRVIDNPEQFINRHDCLTHRLDKPILALYTDKRPSTKHSQGLAPNVHVDPLNSFEYSAHNLYLVVTW